MSRYIVSFMNFFTKTVPITPSLGRWKAKPTKTQEEVFAFYANSDHCGDVICGNPIENKKLIKQNLVKMGLGNDVRCEAPIGIPNSTHPTNHQENPPVGDSPPSIVIRAKS